MNNGYFYSNQQNMGSMPPINPVGLAQNVPMENISNKLNEYAMRKNIDLDYKAREFLTKKSAEIDLLEEREMLKIEREFVRDCVFEDEEGNLKYEVSFRGKSFCTKLLNVQNLRCTCLAGNEDKWIRLTWTSGSEADNVIIPINDFSPKKMSKILFNQGVKIYSSQRKQKDCLVALIAHLKREMCEVAIPEHHGWCKLNGSWFFADGKEMTADELRKLF